MTNKENGQIQQEKQANNNATSSDATNGAVAQMPSRVAEFAQCAGIRGRPAQMEQKVMTPKDIALILRQMGDELEERAINTSENRV